MITVRLAVYQYHLGIVDLVCAMHNRLVARIGGVACVLFFFFFLVHISVLHANFERFVRLRPLTSSENAGRPTVPSRDNQIGDQMSPSSSASTRTRSELLEPDHGGPNIESPTRSSSALASTTVDKMTMSFPPGSGPEDKIIVMGKLQHEDTDWVAEFLPE